MTNDEGFNAITTIVTSGSATAEAVQADVFAFHRMLASKYAGVKASVVIAPDYKWRVKAENANIRSGPGTSFPIVGGVKRGDVLQELEKNLNGWIRCEFGWISGILLEAL